jgi:hypothetical protein
LDFGDLVFDFYFVFALGSDRNGSGNSLGYFFSFPLSQSSNHSMKQVTNRSGSANQFIHGNLENHFELIKLREQ